MKRKKLFNKVIPETFQGSKVLDAFEAPVYYKNLYQSLNESLEAIGIDGPLESNEGLGNDDFYDYLKRNLTVSQHKQFKRLFESLKDAFWAKFYLENEGDQDWKHLKYDWETDMIYLVEDDGEDGPSLSGFLKLLKEMKEDLE